MVHVMSEVKDFCNQPRVVRTGMGWGVRIDGTDVFEGVNQHGYKTLRTLDIVTGLSSEQEANAYLTKWLSDQLPDFDAQRLRADTAEADLLRTSDALLAAEQRIAELERDAARYQWLRDKSQNHDQFYLSTPLYFTGVKFSKENVDRTIDAAINPNPEA